MNYIKGTKIEDLTGEVFGDIRVLSYKGKAGKHPVWNIECVCCDKVFTMQSTHLKNKITGMGCGAGCSVRINDVVHTDEGLSLVDVSTKTNPDKVCIVDTEDYFKYMTGSKWYVEPASDGKNFYVRARVGGIKVKLHRVLLGLTTEDSWVVDHINGSGLDNRRFNIRKVTHADNMKNLHINCNNISGATGVHWYTPYGKWVASIRVNNKNKHLGYFHVKEDAIQARKEAEVLLGFHENHGKERIVYE